MASRTRTPFLFRPTALTSWNRSAVRRARDAIERSRRQRCRLPACSRVACPGRIRSARTAGLELRNQLLRLAPTPPTPYYICLPAMHPLTASPTSTKEKIRSSDAYEETC